jgi:hypothetical protein
MADTKLMYYGGHMIQHALTHLYCLLYRNISLIICYTLYFYMYKENKLWRK